MANSGTPITNSGATTGDPQNFEVCSRTGFKVLPGSIVKDGYGVLCRAESADSVHPQDRLRSRGNESQRGPVSPEGTDTFVPAYPNGTSAEDL